MPPPLALYVHIPFCERRCPYCDFPTTVAPREVQEDYLRALRREIDWAGGQWAEMAFQIETIYFGGGTPTVLCPEELVGVLARVRDNFPISDDAEVTVEANPGTVDEAGLSALRAAGVNRVSLGIQALDDGLLRTLGRIHTASDARASIRKAHRAGFENLSADLMFGVPGQTLEQWRASVAELAELGVAHASIYGLTYEPGTPFQRALLDGRLRPTEEDLELEMFWLVEEILGGRGMSRYEISNFARPGRECRHNLIYWTRGDYLGVGSAAHSSIGGERFWNARDPGEYTGRVLAGLPPREGGEFVSEEEGFREAIMLGLRLSRGVDLTHISVPTMLVRPFQDALQRMVRGGLIEKSDGYIRLTDRGLPVANEVILGLC